MMSSMKSILAATDLSAPSRHAADRAALLARANGAKLTLAHALVATALDDLLRLDRRRRSDESRSSRPTPATAFTRWPCSLGQRHELAVTEHLSIGNPVQELARVAEEIDADLLVTGTRGAGFFRGVVTGSTAERVARRSARPVLMVRQSAHEPYQRVLVPVDFSAWTCAVDRAGPPGRPGRRAGVAARGRGAFRGQAAAGRRDREPAGRIPRRRRSARRNGASTKSLRQRASTNDGSDWSSSDGADPWMQIVRQELEQDCDLIVIGKHGRHVLEELLLGSTTRMVIAESSADVLVSTRSAS